MLVLLAAITTLAVAAAPTEPTPAAPPAPRTWAVVVGVGELADPRLTGVPHGPADAERLRDVLTTSAGLPAERVLLLADGGAPYFDPARPVAHAAPTRRNLRLALGPWLAARVRPGDRVLVVWSGQATIGPDGEALLVTADAARDDLAGTALDAAWVASTLTALPAAGSALWLDASFGGRGAPAFTPPTGKGVRFEALVPPRVALWLAAPTDTLAAEAGPHGAFTSALATALTSGADRPTNDLWKAVVAALPAAAPRPVRLGQADLDGLFAPRRARERPELVLQAPHVGRIAAAAFDPTGRWLATTSQDGTLKLWSVASHRVVATLDTPGAGAMIDWSPDGERVLAYGSAGVTAWSTAVRRLWHAALDPGEWAERAQAIRDGMSSPVRFAPDGALVVIPHARGATELRAADDGRVVARLPAGHTGYGPTAWDPSGRWLAIASTDRKDVRVYAVRPAGDFREVARLRGGARATSLAFSGDGATLAVARFQPEDRGDFPPQDVTLYASGRAFAPRAGAPPLVANLPLAASRDGRILAVPARDHVTLVRLDTLTTTQVGLTASGESAGGLVQIAADGRSLALYIADDTRLYDLAGALLRTIPGEAIALAPDLSAALSGSSSNWGDQLQFKDLTGRHPPRDLEAEARPILALAATTVGGALHLVARDPSGVLVFDAATGRPVAAAGATPPEIARAPGDTITTPIGPGLVARWRAPRFPDGLCPLSPDKALCQRWDEVPPAGAYDVALWDVAKNRQVGALVGHRAPITGVVATADGKTIVTASLDTTLRLWDAASGAELATVTLLARAGDAERWVIAAPDGLFDGSPAGQAELQWRVGDALFRLEQYAGELYTPGLLGKLLGGERPKAALVVEDLAPPPRVRIASPARGTSVADGVVKVVVKVEDQGGGATPAWLYVNGRRVPTTRARPLGGAAEAFEVELVEGDNHLRATAFNRDGTVESAGDALTITWAVPPAERPVLWVVAVGVDAYEEPALRLSFAGADAKAIAAAFAPGLFGRVEARVLLDRDATRANIRAAIAAVAAKARPRDALVVYLAGHGALVGSTFHFLPWEARATSDDEVARTGLSQAELADALVQVPATKQVVVLDACHSGAGAAALGRLVAQRDAVGLARAQRRLAKASGIFLVAASTAAQKAGEIKALGHGVLTYALLTGIGALGAPGARTTADGHVTMNALLAWLDDEVPRLTARYQGGPQTPVQSSTGQDFPITLITPR